MLLERPLVSAVVASLLSAATCLADEEDPFPPDMSMGDLASYWGFRMETHHVTTDDGYVLKLHRLPFSGSESASGASSVEPVDKPVVFLKHGLTSASSHYLYGPSGNNIGYVLADSGYDVWMGNTRGNTYSRRHVTLDPDLDKEEFWAFDFEVAARGDFPAVFQHILDVTGRDKMFYVGSSMGTTEFFAAMSMDPQLQNVIDAAFLMCPVAYMDGVVGFFDVLASYVEPLETFFEELGFWEYAADKPVSSVIGHDYCDYDDFPDNEEFCLSLSDAVFALSPGQLNVTMLPWYFDFKAEGASVKTVLHYGQVVNRTGHFPRYDLGREGNLEAYGQASPPDYDLGSIGVPTYLYWGDSDALATPTDVQKLAEELPDVRSLYQVPLEGWVHNDFSMAIDAKELVYDVILADMENFVP